MKKWKFATMCAVNVIWKGETVQPPQWSALYVKMSPAYWKHQMNSWVIVILRGHKISILGCIVSVWVSLIKIDSVHWSKINYFHSPSAFFKYKNQNKKMPSLCVLNLYKRFHCRKYNDDKWWKGLTLQKTKWWAEHKAHKKWIRGKTFLFLLLLSPFPLFENYSSKFHLKSPIIIERSHF